MEDNILGLQIKKYRLQAGLTQGELAAAVNRDRSWLAHVERGDYRPQAVQLVRLAECVRVPAALFLGCIDRQADAAEESDEHMRRQVMRQFSSSWKRGYRSSLDEPGCWAASLLQLQAFLERRVADTAVRLKLKAFGLGCCEAACLALSLLERGARWANAALADVGFPEAVIDKDNCCVNHLPRPCLVWTDGGRSLVFMGEFFGLSPRFLPPILAWTERKYRSFFMAEGERFASNAEHLGRMRPRGRQPRLLTAKESQRHQCTVQRLILRGVGEDAIRQWLDWLFKK